MALEAKNINNATDMRNYVEGCLNDLMEGISSKEETMGYLHDYTLRVINLTAERVGQPASTSDEALHIDNVVGRSEQCAHPRDKREYIGSNMLRCKVCGKEFS